MAYNVLEQSFIMLARILHRPYLQNRLAMSSHALLVSVTRVAN